MDAFEQQQRVNDELFKPDITHNQQNTFEDHELNNGGNLQFHSMEKIVCPCCGNHCKNAHRFHGYREKNQPGFRFNPKDDELISDYLQPRMRKERVPGASNSARIPSLINEVLLYKFSPEELSAVYPPIEDAEAVTKEWYFFTPRDRKYPNGFRPNRAAGNGYWKATGADKKIYNKYDEEIGRKKSLVFYVGKPPKGTKSNWIMHEYRVEPKPEAKRKKQEQCVAAKVMRLDDSVLCRIYQKSKKTAPSKRESKKEKKRAAEEQEIPEDTDNSYFYNNYDAHNETLNNIPDFDEDITDLDFMTDCPSLDDDFHLSEVPYPMDPSSSNYIPQETNHAQWPNQAQSENANAIPRQEAHHPQSFNPGQPMNPLPVFANNNPPTCYTDINNGFYSNNFSHDNGFERLHVRHDPAAWNPFFHNNNMHVGQQQSLVGMYGGQTVQNNVPLGQQQSVFGGRPMMSQNMPDELQGAISGHRVRKMPSPEENFAEGTSGRNGSGGGRKRMKRESRANEMEENLNPQCD